MWGGGGFREVRVTWDDEGRKRNAWVSERKAKETFTFFNFTKPGLSSKP